MVVPPHAKSRAGAALAAGAVAALALAACTGSYRVLRSDRSIPALAARLEASAAIPRREARVVVATAGGEPVRMAVTELGPGTRSRVLLLVHGVLSDSGTWRYMEADLARDADVLLVDLPGCGKSDAPDPKTFGPGAYGPTPLARCVLAALEDRLAAHPSWTQVTFVGHSLGSAIGLRLLGAPPMRGATPRAAATLSRVDSAVFLSSLDFGAAKSDPKLDEVATVSPVTVRLGAAVGLLRSRAADQVLRGAYGACEAPREEADRTARILSCDATLRAAQAMIREAVPTVAHCGDPTDRRPDWPAVEALVADYARVAVPCLLLHGERDETLPAALSYRLRDSLPRAWLRTLPRATHALTTERPGECAEWIRRFAAERGAGWPPD